MKLRSFAALFIGTLLATHCAFAEGSIPAKQADSLIHVSQELTSPFLHGVPEGEEQYPAV